MRTAIFAFALALPLAAAAAAQNPAEVRIQTVEVAPGIAMLVGQGGNIGVVWGEDGVLLVDDQYAPLTDKIRAAVATLTDRPLRFVLNTHWHGDHTGGNENLGKAGVLIVAHDGVRRRMSSEHVSEFFGGTLPASPKAALPVVTFSDSVTFHLDGVEIHAFHVPPAHTDGDSIVHFRGVDVVHMGDIFFNGMYPFIDVESGGSVDGVLAAIERALELIGPDTKVIPGHGPLSDRAGLVAYRDMLRTMRDRVAAMIAEGKSRDEVLAAAPSADYDEAWGGGFLDPGQFLGLVYASLSGK